MKDARRILGLIRGICPQGAFPGRDRHGRTGWRPDPFRVLISTVLSQRTRDQNTHVASARLFARYDTPEKLASAPLEEVEELIRPAGFPKAKGRAIVEISRIIINEHGGKVPSDIEVLTALPMVGRKTANCLRAYAFGIPSICVDRIGLARTKRPDETEAELEKVVPEGLWIDVNSLMVRFGQRVCLPRNPKCRSCPVAPDCDYYAKVYLPAHLGEP
jgi:endonuclease-3